MAGSHVNENTLYRYIQRQRLWFLSRFGLMNYHLNKMFSGLSHKVVKKYINYDVLTAYC